MNGNFSKRMEVVWDYVNEEALRLGDDKIGVEHLIFYSLEYHTKKIFLHGQAVCLGIVIGSLMHKQRSEELKNVINKIGVDIKPNSMSIDWNEVKHSLVNLKNFVEKSNLMWGISNDYVFDEKFFEEMISKIEVKE